MREIKWGHCFLRSSALRLVAVTFTVIWGDLPDSGCAKYRVNGTGCRAALKALFVCSLGKVAPAFGDAGSAQVHGVVEKKVRPLYRRFFRNPACLTRDVAIRV